MRAFKTTTTRGSKKRKEEQAKKREFAKMIAEDINKKIKLIEIQQRKEKAEQLECQRKDAEEKKC